MFTLRFNLKPSAMKGAHGKNMEQTRSASACATIETAAYNAYNVNDVVAPALSPGAGQFPVDAVRRENRGRGGRWLGSEPQQSHNAKRSADYQSHNAKCTARDQGAAPGDEAVVVQYCAVCRRTNFTFQLPFSFVLSKQNTVEISTEVFDSLTTNVNSYFRCFFFSCDDLFREHCSF